MGFLYFARPFLDTLDQLDILKDKSRGNLCFARCKISLVRLAETEYVVRGSFEESIPMIRCIVSCGSCGREVTAALTRPSRSVSVLWDRSKPFITCAS
jgi:hypothetical protein